MAEEEVVAPAAVMALAPSDHKRKLEDNPPLDLNMNSEPDAVENVKDDEGDGASDAKRPRLDEETDGLASENGHKAGKENEAEKENGGEKPTVDNVHLEDAKCLSQEAPDVRNNNESAKVENIEEQSEVDASEQPAKVESSEQAVEVGNEQTGMDQHETEDTQRQTAAENLPQLGHTDLYAEGEQNKPSLETSEKGDAFTVEQQPTSEAQTMSRKMDVPNNKVGVLIGKAGDTIRYLQYNSGAKIQITRDADADPYAATRPVELIGSFENINKAEKLIKDVIAEADAGGSPSLVARGFATAPAAGGGEQIQMQVPNEKVGLIIGKGGETIKSLQTKSGARIQLIPQHLPEGDQSKERTVRVSGDKKQIETAADMIKEVMNQTVRPSPLSSNYNQQTHRSRGPIAPSQWGPRGPHPGPPTGYDYQHRGPHPSQYPPPAYGSYPPQQAAPRGGGYGPGWEHRPSPVMQGPPQTGGYNYYGGPAGSHDVGAHSNSFPAHVPGRSPAAAVGAPSSQPNYNYGQQQGTDYGQPAPYSQTPPQQSYNQAPMPNHHPYGGHGSSYPNYQQTTAQPGYAASQQQYGRPPSYGAQSQGSHPQSYGPPRASQPGDAPYQGPYPSSQSYGQNVASQQPYPYASSGPMQQNYPPYGSVPAGDGYNQQPPASGPGYTQQAAQPVVSSYGQPVGQPGFPQGPQGGYGSYPSTQPVYGEQPAGAVPNTAGYGYQGPVDPSTAYGAPPSGQQAYAQPAPTQTTYDQSVPPSGGYVA